MPVKVRVLGVEMEVEMDESAAARVREGRRSWKRELADKRAAAARAVSDACSQFDKKSIKRPSALSPVMRGCSPPPSALAASLPLIEAAPPAVFWPVMLHLWPVCDATWPYRNKLRACLKTQHSLEPSSAYLPSKTAKFLDLLSDLVTVYRGCSQERIRGLAWTIDKVVAEGFAKGHRSIPVQNAWSLRP